MGMKIAKYDTKRLYVIMNKKPAIYESIRFWSMII